MRQYKDVFSYIVYRLWLSMVGGVIFGITSVIRDSEFESIEALRHE